VAKGPFKFPTTLWGWLIAMIFVCAVVGYLKKGLGFDILEWIQSPSVDVPDTVDIPGGK